MGPRQRLGPHPWSVQNLWCWRCREEVPMLDEQEWAEVQAAMYPPGDRGSMGAVPGTPGHWISRIRTDYGPGGSSAQRRRPPPCIPIRSPVQVLWETATHAESRILCRLRGQRGLGQRTKSPVGGRRCPPLNATPAHPPSASFQCLVPDRARRSSDKRGPDLLRSRLFRGFPLQAETEARVRRWTLLAN